jgi:N-succinyldiaminopimelate aminotransferase
MMGSGFLPGFLLFQVAAEHELQTVAKEELRAARLGCLRGCSTPSAMPRFPLLAPGARGFSEGVFGKVVQRSADKPARVYSLHVGDTYLEPFDLARAEAQSTADHPRLHNYAPTQGEPVLLQAIVDKVSRRSGVTLDPECIQVMAGATAAMGIICSALLSPGDEVIIPAPFWPLIRGAVRSRSGVAVEVPLFNRLDDPSFDPLAALERAITPRTCAIYLNTPHNPTGRIVSEPLLAGIANLAARHDLWIISDEAYEDIYFGTDAPPSPFARSDMADRVIATHSISKAYAMAGARVGYTHGPRELMAVIRGIQTFYSYCAPRPMQFAAAQALNHADAWLFNMRQVYGQAAQLAANALGEPVPQAGTFLFFDVRRFLRPEETLVELLERCLDAGVMLTPGTSCGDDFGHYARLCFTTVPEPDLRDALAKLRTVLFAD